MPSSINPFILERYFAQYEFEAPYLLSCSDSETLSISELLALAEQPLTNLGALSLGYTESPGAPSLRTAIAKLYEQALSPDNVLIVTPEEGIFLCMWALVSAGDGVIVQTPCYQSLAELAAYHGATVTPWPLQETEIGWAINLEQLADLICPATKLLVINTPHNPTGYHFSPEEFAAVIDLARAHNLWLLCDEMYWGGEYHPTDRLPPACSRYERAITLSGMSKTYGLPGLRIGWLASQDRRLVSRWQALKDYTTICASAPSEFLAEVALGIAPQLMARSHNIIRANLAAARAFAERWSHLIAWRAPQAGPIAFIRYRPGGVQAMAADLVQSAGVMLVPAHPFNFGDAHFRLGLGRVNFPEALGRFEQFLEDAG